MPAPINLTETDLEDLGNRIKDNQHHGKREREGWEKKLPTWRRLYEGQVTEKSEPWDNASNINLDIIGDNVDEFVARAMSTLFGDRKWAPAVPTEDYDDERWHVVEQFMQWALQSEMQAWGDFEAILQELSINGTCFVYTPWKKRKRTTREIKYRPKSVEVEDGKKRALTDREILRSVFGEMLQGVPRRRKGQDFYVANLLEHGRQHTAKIWIDRRPEDRSGEVAVEIEREEVTRDCPDLRVLEPTHLWTTDTGDLQEAPYVHVLQYWTKDWMTRQYRSGALNMVSEEDWTRITKNWKPGDMKETSFRAEDEVEDEKDDLLGIDTSTQASGTRPILVCFMRWDLNGDGLEEEAIIEYDPVFHVVLSVDYLDRRYPHGSRPVTAFRWRQVANRLYGIGIPEHLWNTQIMVNATINKAYNAADVKNLPWWFYDKTSGLDGSERRLLKPGKGIGVIGNPNDKVREGTAGFNPQDLLGGFVETLVSFGDRRIGRNSVLPGGNKKAGVGTGAPRTFGGTNLIMQEGLLRHDHVIKQIAMGGQGMENGFNALFHQIFELYAHLMPQHKKFNVMGPNGVETLEITRDDLRIRPDFMFSVNMLASNPAVRRADALLMFQTVAPQLAQAGFMPQWAGHLKRLYRAYDIMNPQELTPPDPNFMGRPPLDPATEHFIMIGNGKPWDPHPADDDMTHIQDHNRVFEESLQSGMPPENLMELQQHITKTINVIEQKEQALATQGGNGGGRPMGGERRNPGQPRQARPPMGGTF